MSDSKISVVLFGAGNMAVHLLDVFLQHPDKIQVLGAWNRHPEKLSKRFGDRIRIFKQLLEIPTAHVYILAVKDDAVSELSGRLPQKNVLRVHTSGVLPMSAIPGRRKGFFYPLQSFHKDKPVVRWKDIPVFVNASSQRDKELLKTLAGIISDHPVPITGEQKKILHIAAVFANNFSNAMFIAAYKILQESGIKPDYLLPLIKETVNRLQNGSPRALQTGPARRGDRNTIDRHRDWLKNNRFTGELSVYDAITNFIIKEFENE